MTFALGSMVAPRSMKRIVISTLGVIHVIGAFGLTLFSFWQRVRILDKRFQVVSVAASRGTNQTIYFGSQLAGRIREGVAKLGLPVKPTTKAPATLKDNSYIWLWVIYRGNFPAAQLESVQAELRDSAGGLIRLRQGVHERDPFGKNYLGGWIQLLPHTNGLTYSLRLKLPDSGGQLADIKLGRL
jgi:hypothetical protein